MRTSKAAVGGAAAALAVSILSAVSPRGAGAAEWIVLGPRAMGMGGAQTAIADGPLAAYWNPAGLGDLHGISGLVFPVAARGEFAGSAAEGALDLNQLVLDCRNGSPACTTADINSALSRLGQPGSGVLADAGAAAMLRIRSFSVFFNNLTYVGVTPSADLAPARTTPAGVPSNRSALLIRDANFGELGAGYARAVGESGLTIGADVKAIVGRIGFAGVNIATEDPDGAGLSSLIRSTKTSLQPGVDAGLEWEASRLLTFLPWRTRLGVAGRDLNNPTFSQPAAALAAGDRNRFSLHAQGRAGLAVYPARTWVLAADLDVTENVTQVEGYKSRYASVGTEFLAVDAEGFKVPVRLGAQKNVASALSGPSVSGGFGLRFRRLSLDVAAMIGVKRTMVQSQDESLRYPNNIGISAQLAIPFGASEEIVSEP